MKPSKQSSESWEERFDREFLQCNSCGSCDCEYEGKDRCFHGTEDSIKSFIQQEIDKARSEEREEFAKKVEKEVIGEDEFDVERNFRNKQQRQALKLLVEQSK